MRFEGHSVDLCQGNIIKFCSISDELVGVGITATTLHCDNEDYSNNVTDMDDI